MEKVKEILELGQISKYVAIIVTDSGKEIRIPWTVLESYWDYANYDEIDFISASFIDEFIVICMTALCGESGIIAVYDCSKEDWIHIQKGDYVYCALLLKEFNTIVSLHYISNEEVEGHQAVFTNKLSTGELWLDDKLIKEISVEWEERAFKPKNYEIDQSIQLDTIAECLRKCGPTGLFYSAKDGVIYAHDACNLAVIKVNDIFRS